MCGIGAWLFSSDFEKLNKLNLLSLINACALRGRDSTGVYLVHPGRDVSIKLVGGPEGLSDGWCPEWDTLEVKRNDIVLVSCRGQPLTEEESRANDTIPPILVRHEQMDGYSVTVHNGAIPNAEEYMELRGIERVSKLDSEAIPHALFRNELHELSGGIAAIVYTSWNDKIHLLRNWQPLYYGRDGRDIFAFSEKAWIPHLFQRRPNPLSQLSGEEVPAYTHLMINVGERMVEQQYP